MLKECPKCGRVMVYLGNLTNGHEWFCKHWHWNQNSGRYDAGCGKLHSDIVKEMAQPTIKKPPTKRRKR